MARSLSSDICRIAEGRRLLVSGHSSVSRGNYQHHRAIAVLEVRLWANIFASDLIYALFLSLFLAPALWGWTKPPGDGLARVFFPR